MSASQSEIRESITSKDPEVLRLSLEFARDRLSKEDIRGKTAEDRANTMLAVVGVIAGLVLPQAKPYISAQGGTSWLLLTTFIASLAFLVRATFYAMSVISITNRHRTIPQTVYDHQGYSVVSFMREQIVAAIWEYEMALGPNNQKLFLLSRCQRNTVLAVFLLIFLGLLRVVSSDSFVFPLIFAPCFGVVYSALFFFGDWVLERRGIWNARS